MAPRTPARGDRYRLLRMADPRRAIRGARAPDDCRRLDWCVREVTGCSPVPSSFTVRRPWEDPLAGPRPELRHRRQSTPQRTWSTSTSSEPPCIRASRRGLPAPRAEMRSTRRSREPRRPSTIPTVRAPTCSKTEGDGRVSSSPCHRPCWYPKYVP